MGGPPAPSALLWALPVWGAAHRPCVRAGVNERRGSCSWPFISINYFYLH